MPRVSSRHRRVPSDRPIASALREIIRKRGLTAYGLGKRAGVDPGQVSRFLSGERDLTLATVDRIAGALGLRLAELAHRTRRPVGMGPAPEATAPGAVGPEVAS